MSQFDPVTLEIIWSRLLTITEEMWTTTLRTAVSTIIGVANDFSCEILDAEGRSMTHAYRSMPVFNMVMPHVVKHLLKKFPRDHMQPGDIFLTNDPWLCAGHTPDIAIVTPIFSRGRVIGFVGNIANTSDIGGALDLRKVRDSYEEGILFPLCYLYRAGEPNSLVFELFEKNVRIPEMVLADLEAQVAANEVGAHRMLALLAEYGLEDLSGLSHEVRSRSEQAMRRAIRELPDGVYRNEVYTDGLGTPLKLSAVITIRGEHIHADYAGSAPQVDRGGLNCTLPYTTGHTLFPLKCLLTPTVPSNEGDFAPVSLYAPEGSILNCTFPASVGSRVNTGWYLHELIFGALANVLPERVQAGNGLMSSLRAYGIDPAGRPYNAHLFAGGGRGAGGGRDGISANMFPSSAANVPVEVFELNAPVLIMEKEFIPDSAGVGKHRGRPGQRLSLAKLPTHPLPVSVFFHPARLYTPARGLFGGQDASPGRLIFHDEVITEDPASFTEGTVTLEKDTDLLTYEISGGAGMGDPRDRPRDLVQQDVRDGLVSPG
ncbi:MAG: hydantoinase B/oxoprolinase family protein [Nitrospinae bacterium]|nr:hydantoinase B/oxoprolinase family protein [Nitrospinota bacterium]